MKKIITFACDKLSRDKGLETFKAEGITPQYKLLKDDELRNVLKIKLMEEGYELCEAETIQEVVAELADVLEVIDGLCKAYKISLEDIQKIKEKKLKERGGFEKGLFIETIEMEESNPKVKHFRASPDKYPEVDE